MNDLQSVKSFLSTRRSFPPNILSAPYPSREILEKIAQMALRVPDHKKLEPWRLIVLKDQALQTFAKKVEEIASLYWSDPQKCEKIANLYKDAGCVIALIYCPKNEPLVPEWEQILSVGAVGLSLVNATIANGFGAAWMTGFLPESSEIAHLLKLETSERLMGLIHTGTPKNQPPERPRADISQKLSFL